MKIRQATLKDFDRINELNGYCYGFDAKAVKDRFWLKYEFTFDENYCLEIDNKVVANTRCIPLEQNIRGKWLKMAGIAMVVSDPVSRRKGYVRETMNYLLKKMSDEKYAVTTLYPFKDTFYAAFGYVNAPPSVKMKVNPKFFSKWKRLPKGYSVERLTHTEAFEIYKSIHNKAVNNIHGAVRRSEKRWKEHDGPSPAWYAVAFNEKKEPEGFLRYRSKGFSTGFDWSEDGLITISDMFTLTPYARHALFNYLFLHSDQIIEVAIPMNPNESDLYTWLQNYYKTKLHPDVVFMARIVDVEETLQDMKVPFDGQITVKITDSHISKNNQTFEITAEKNALKISAMGDNPAETEMTIEGLTSLVFGILPATDLEPFNWLTKSKKADIDLLDKWFPMKKPWLTEGF
ncbi:MAG: GNAT family N-acetyltransferase [Candidatus Heimdallarchaeota archaeon]